MIFLWYHSYNCRDGIVRSVMIAELSVFCHMSSVSGCNEQDPGCGSPEQEGLEHPGIAVSFPGPYGVDIVGDIGGGQKLCDGLYPGGHGVVA